MPQKTPQKRQKLPFKQLDWAARAAIQDNLRQLRENGEYRRASAALQAHHAALKRSILRKARAVAAICRARGLAS